MRVCNRCRGIVAKTGQVLEYGPGQNPPVLCCCPPHQRDSYLQPSLLGASPFTNQPRKEPMHHIESPRADDCAIEQEIQAKGKTAPRVTPARIEAVIVSEHYFTAGDGAFGAAYRGPRGGEGDTFSWQEPPALNLLTFCVLVLRNGFTVTGESACASPENFDPEIGRKIARENAKNKIWALEGYLLKEQLHERDLSVGIEKMMYGTPG